MSDEIVEQIKGMLRYHHRMIGGKLTSCGNSEDELLAICDINGELILAIEELLEDNK